MLGVSINGLYFPSPVLLASGVLDETGDTMLRVARAGAGGIVTKSVGLNEREGYKNPVVYELPDGMGVLNAIGLANPGIENYGDEIRVALKGGVPVIGSIFGSTPEEFAHLARKMEQYGVHGVELNLSCPHASGYGMEVGVDTELVEEIVAAVKSAVQVPVWAKLTPNTHNLRGIAEAAMGADAFVLINTVRGMAIDVEAHMPVLSNIYGGLSGPCIKPVGVRAVYELYREFEKPIIGVGGVVSGRDALEYIMAGASAVQVGTAVLYRGIGVFGEIARELEQWLEEHGYSSISDVVGVAQVR